MSQPHWLLTYSRSLYEEQSQALIVHFFEDVSSEKFAHANALLNDLEHYPHHFVLACCMDRQVPAERAWIIPYKIGELYGDFSMQALAEKTEEEIVSTFSTHNLHRFSEKMAKVFYSAVQLIHKKYDDDASHIWSDCPSSAELVYRFLQFDGVGVKIATMAANILTRQYGVPVADMSSIDISPDVHVIRVFERTGLVEHHSSREAVIYKARAISPEYPGVFDGACWRIGREYCHPQSPSCEKCPVGGLCPKLM